MKQCYLLLVSMLFISNVIAQRYFDFVPNESDSIKCIVSSNRSKTLDFPGMTAYFIVGASDHSPHVLFEQDSFRRMPVRGMSDYALFFYFDQNMMPFLTDTLKLDTLIKFLHYENYINRNRIHLVVNNPDFNCQALLKTRQYFASITLQNDTTCNDLPHFNVQTQSLDSIWRQQHLTRSEKKYPITTQAVMEQIQAEKAAVRRKKAVSNWKNTLYVSASLGSFYYTNKSSYDTATLVNFAANKRHINFNLGYQVNNNIAIELNAGLLRVPKNLSLDSIKNVNGSLIMYGSGNGGAAINYGLGIRFSLIFNGLQSFAAMHYGRVLAIAGGGNARRTIGGGGGGNSTDIKKVEENRSMITTALGCNYRLSGAIFIRLAGEYKHSTFSQPLGSVNGIQGFSFNIGAGFIIPLKQIK